MIDGKYCEIPKKMDYCACFDVFERDLFDVTNGNEK